MQGMTRPPVTLIAAFALTLAVALGAAAPASPAGEQGPWVDHAIVDVATPKLPVREEAGKRWREVRADAAQQLGDVAADRGLDVTARIPETGQLIVDLGGVSVDELRRRLAGDPRVNQVTSDGPVELRLVPNDPIFGTIDGNAPVDDFAQWHLRPYGAIRAWDLSKGTGAEVAVIDSGIDSEHPDLAGRISGQLVCEPACVAAPADDTEGHGTHVSGLACADSNSGFGLASLGFDCNIFAIRVVLSCGAVASAITRAADRGSDAINLSLGGCGADVLEDPLAYAWAQGSVPVAAGANEPVPDPSTNYPAQYVQPEGTGPNLGQGRGLVVTSSKYGGSRSAFAQRTSGVSVSAHGSASDEVSGGQQGILSTWPAPGFPVPLFYDNVFATNPVRTTFFGDNRFAYLVGTSMASPQVAGLVALMRSAKPSLSNSKLVKRIKQTATGCGRYAGGIGWGVIRADVAVGAARDRDTDPPGSRVRSARRARGKKGVIDLRLKRFDKTCVKMIPATGVKSVSVFVSRNGSRYKRFRKTKRKTIRFRGKPGRRYRFYSRAVDRAGNKEPAPATADAKLRLRRK